MPKLFIVDGSSYFYRAYFAVSALSTSQGLPTNAIFGFSNMLLKLIRDFKPEYLAIAFDTPKPSFRNQIYQEYKANREEMPTDLQEQIPYIKKVVEAFEIPHFEKEGFEADDIIATVARTLEKQKWDVVIISGDKDLMQLVDDRISMFDTMRDKEYKIEDVKQKFNVLPERLADVLALAGDTSDNIPGVPNIGLKTAGRLVSQYGRLSAIYENLDQLTPKLKESLIHFKENAVMSRELVQLNEAVPFDWNISSLKYNGYHEQKLAELFKLLEFNKLSKELGLKVETQSLIDYKKYTYIKNEKEFHGLVEKLKKSKNFSFDFETTGLNPLKAKLVGMSFSLGPDDHMYVPLAHEQLPADAKPISVAGALEKLQPLFEDENIKKVGQNLKYEYCILKQYGISLKGICDDTMVASYLVNPEMAHNLDALALQYLNHQNITFDEMVPDKKKTFASVPVEKAYLYACEDADVALRLSHIFREKLTHNGMLKLYEDVELPLISVLSEMEAQGVKIDTAFLKNLSVRMEKEIKELETKIFKLAGGEFNVRSPKQLSHILFEKLKLPVVIKTKTGFSTNEEVLQTLSSKHELPTLLLQYREVDKLKSTYVDALFDLADPDTKRVHTSYNQTVVATGRLSSSNPNLQNIPIRTERGRDIRHAFIAEKGFSILSADYSQIELRLLAHFSSDEKLMWAFKNDEDVHEATAREVFKTPGDKKVTSEERRIAKAINFGIIYGQSAYGLSRTLEIPPEEAQKYIDGYFEKYSGVREYLQKSLYETRKKGYATTILGRRRYLPNLRSANQQLLKMAERMAVNAPLQGSAADLIKLAMIHVYREMEKKKMESRLIMQVHDELVFEVLKREEKDMSSLVKKEMESALELSVPLKVDMSCASNWGE